MSTTKVITISTPPNFDEPSFFKHSTVIALSKDSIQPGPSAAVPKPVHEQQELLSVVCLFQPSRLTLDLPLHFLRGHERIKAMLRGAFTVGLVALAAQIAVAEEATYKVSAYYLGDKCTGTPYAVYSSKVTGSTACTSEECSPSTNTAGSDMMVTKCSSDYIQTTRDMFGNYPYIIESMHTDDTCTGLSMSYGYPASGACVGAYDKSYYVIATLNSNGSASVQFSQERSCLSSSLYRTDFANKTELEKHSCSSNGYSWYSSLDDQNAGSNSTSGGPPKDNDSGMHDDSGGGLATGAIVGIALSGFFLALVIVVVVAIFYKRRATTKKLSSSLKETLRTNSVAMLETPVPGQTGLWNDDIITAKRVPRDKVITQMLISRGAFGEVYSGVFNGELVAIKMLLPSTRGNIKEVNDFLAEAKIHATMDHAHIVMFVGVAWDALSDLCVLLEYMDSGELRTLLNNYLEQKQPTGFDQQKTTIALQVAHALTYLHSLDPPVIHRDLKSRNILFNADMDAKLSDFGISRERMDQTMTAGVGTSLWMAPEVMMGERYDHKADIFSFGVVMSELDVHTLPYSRAKKECLQSSGRTMADSVLLQKVALGTIQADFTASSPEEIVELGRACMSVDPTKRPTAAEALYKIHVSLQKMKSAAV